MIDSFAAATVEDDDAFAEQGKPCSHRGTKDTDPGFTDARYLPCSSRCLRRHRSVSPSRLSTPGQRRAFVFPLLTSLHPAQSSTKKTEESSMPGIWYVESYAEDGISAEGSEEHETYEAAFASVKAIRETGKTARFMAPVGATEEQIDSFRKLGMVQRI
jgi:hypothetical protein